MKKNLKFVSAAAAALLAVAPVAASTVNAAVVLPGGDAATASKTQPTQVTGQTPAYFLTFSSNLDNVDASTPVSTLVSDANVMKALSVKSSSDSAPSIVAVKDSKISDKANGGTIQTSLKAGNTYYLQTTVTVVGLHKQLKDNEAYTSKTATISNNGKTTDQGSLTDIKLSIKFTAMDKNAVGQPFFANEKGQAYSDGQTVPVSVKASSLTHIVDVQNAMKNMHVKAFASSADKKVVWNYPSFDDVKAQLAKQGVTVDKNGLSKDFTYTATATNPINGKTATLNFYFKADANYSLYPKISYKGVWAKQGEQSNSQNIAQPIVKLGDKDWATTVLKNFTAFQSSNNDQRLVLTTQNLTASSMDYNKTGVYNATLKATNSNGLTTSYDFNIIVVGSEKDATATKTVTGNNGEVVRLNSIVDGKVSYLSGEVKNQGSEITVYPNDTTTVDGVEYTRVYKAGVNRENNNEWIKTSNLEGSKKVAVKRVFNKKLTKVYNSKGQAENGGKVIGWKIGSGHDVEAQPVLINGTVYYKVASGIYKGLYVNVNNFSDTKVSVSTRKSLKIRSRVYSVHGRVVKRHGKTVYYAKGHSFKILGKKTIKGRAYYKIATNRYILVHNFR